jgi:predicted DNA-binding transcriptional regulator YafY
MVGVSLTGDGFDPPVGFSVQDVLQGGRVFRRDEPPGDTLVVRYSSRVSRWIAEREHRSLDEQGELVVEYPLADEAWAVRHVLQYGPDAVILQPVALRDRVAAVLDALLP